MRSTPRGSSARRSTPTRSRSSRPSADRRRDPLVARAVPRVARGAEDATPHVTPPPASDAPSSAGSGSSVAWATLRKQWDTTRTQQQRQQQPVTSAEGRRLFAGPGCEQCAEARSDLDAAHAEVARLQRGLNEAEEERDAATARAVRAEADAARLAFSSRTRSRLRCLFVRHRAAAVARVAYAHEREVKLIGEALLELGVDDMDDLKELARIRPSAIDEMSASAWSTDPRDDSTQDPQRDPKTRPGA